MRERKNVPVAEPAPINAWRILKPGERKENTHVANEAKPKPVEPPTGQFELINLADKVNERERNLRAPTIATEEDVLKKILGLSQSKPNPVNHLVSEVKNEVSNDSQRIDLNSLFGRAESKANEPQNGLPLLSSLPKPPTAWQQKAHNKETKKNAHQAPLHQMPSHPQFPSNIPMNMGHQMHHQPYFPLPNMMPAMNMPFHQQHAMPYHRQPMMFRPGPNYPMLVIPGPQPFIQVPQHIRMSGPPLSGPPQFDGQHRHQHSPHHGILHSPEGPQKLKTKNGSSSAFIPLQAARKNIKGKSNVNANANDVKTDEPLDNPAEQETNVVGVFYC